MAGKIPEQPHSADYASLSREIAEPIENQTEPARPIGTPQQSFSKSMPGPGELPPLAVGSRQAGLSELNQKEAKADQKQADSDKEFLEEARALNAQALEHETQESSLDTEKAKDQ